MKKSTYFAYAKDFVAFVGANRVTLYTSLLMEAQQKPEGLKRPQAGVKPLQIGGCNPNPQGVAEHSVALSGLT